MFRFTSSFTFFCPHIPHEYFAIEEPWTMKWIAFDGHQTQYILSLLDTREYEVFHMPEFQQIGTLIEDIYHIMDSNKPGKLLESSSMLFSLLVKWDKWLNKNKTTPRRKTLSNSPIQYLINIRIQKAKHLLIKDSSSLVKCIANQVGFNDVSYFCSVFKEHEGLTPN